MMSSASFVTHKLPIFQFSFYVKCAFLSIKNALKLLFWLALFKGVSIYKPHVILLKLNPIVIVNPILNGFYSSTISFVRFCIRLQSRKVFSPKRYETKRTRHLIHFSTILSKYKFFTDLLFFLFDVIEIFLANWWASRCSMRLLNRIKPDQKGLFWDVFLTKANSKL